MAVAATQTTTRKGAKQPRSAPEPLTLSPRESSVAAQDRVAWQQFVTEAGVPATYVRAHVTSKFKVAEVLGEGEFGQVVLLRSRLDGRPLCVAKQFRDRKQPGAFARAKREFDWQFRARHPHVLSAQQLWATCASPAKRAFWILLPYIPQGNLTTELLAKGPMDAVRARGIVGGVRNALHMLHRELGLVHRDVNPNNIYLFRSERREQNADGTTTLVELETPKLGDFGSVAYLRNRPRCQTHGPYGTPEYMAPEVVGTDAESVGKRNDTYGFEVDVWALGLTLVRMLTLMRPFAGIDADATFANIRADTHDDWLAPTQAICPEAAAFISVCLQRDPKVRASAASLGQHPFLALLVPAAGGIASSTPSYSTRSLTPAEVAEILEARKRERPD